MRSIPSLPLAAMIGGLLLAPVAATAHGYEIGALRIGHPWAKPTPNTAPNGEGFLTVTNTGRTPDRLLGASSPRFRAITPHSMSMSGGVMRMRDLPNGFVIAPGATLTLAPGGDHLMLEGPKAPLKVGDHVPATLRFERAGTLKVYFKVQDAAGETMPGMAAH